MDRPSGPAPTQDAPAVALNLMQQAMDVLDGAGREFLEVKARLQGAMDALLATMASG